MIELNSKIKEALIEIDFIKRYEEVSNKFNAERTPSKSRLVYIDGEEVMEIIWDILRYLIVKKNFIRLGKSKLKGLHWEFILFYKVEWLI